MGGYRWRSIYVYIVVTVDGRRGWRSRVGDGEQTDVGVVVYRSTLLQPALSIVKV